MAAPVGAAIAQTPEASNSLLNVVDISAAYTVLQSDSGNVFMLSGGPYTITLPVAAALEQGWYCKFIVKWWTVYNYTTSRCCFRARLVL